MMGFFRAVKNIFLGIMSFCMLSVLGLVYPRPIDDSGLGMSGILAFGLWVLLMIIFFKISTVGAAGIGLIIYVTGRIMKVGISGDLMEEIGPYIGWLVILYIFYKIFLSGGGEQPETKGRGGRNENKCPRCGSNLVYVPEHREPTGEYEDYEGKGHWEYDYSTSQTKSTWVREYHHDPVYIIVPGHYECTNKSCGYKS